jgi:hypothetical protein
MTGKTVPKVRRESRHNDIPPISPRTPGLGSSVLRRAREAVPYDGAVPYRPGIGTARPSDRLDQSVLGVRRGLGARGIRAEPGMAESGTVQIHCPFLED